MSAKNRYPKQDRYINLLTDFGFKRLFGTKPNTNKKLVSEIANFSVVEQEAYENSLKYYRDLQNVVATSREEGIEEGRQEGFEQGKQEGIEEGRQEGREQTKIEIARSCIQQGLDTETIMAITQLSREDIEALRVG
ncbi:MAG: Rpn family recombination-promoting nuclease/putative transposase [Symploca sp. SIO2D2]|nr:Rpn family recombination-promoting nuclease/putative transposase [Symploca sp. SIO2D2]